MGDSGLQLHRNTGGSDLQISHTGGSNLQISNTGDGDLQISNTEDNGLQILVGPLPINYPLNVHCTMGDQCLRTVLRPSSPLASSWWSQPYPVYVWQPICLFIYFIYNYFFTDIETESNITSKEK